MPRYFCHIMDGSAILDTEGTELENLDAARHMAVKTAGQLLKDAGAQFWHSRPMTVYVTDEAGSIVASLRFTANS